MPSESGFSHSLHGKIWYCHCCHREFGQPSDASRPVCPFCKDGCVEIIGVEEKEAVEGLPRGIQSLASLDSRRPLNLYRLPSQGSVPDVGYSSLRLNGGQSLRSHGRGQRLGDSVDSHYRRRGSTPASNASMDALEVVKVNGTDAATECTICKEQINVGAYVNRLPCGHLYHAWCIGEWLVEKNSCPLCRFEMPIGVPDCDRGHSGCGHGASFSGRRLSSSQTRPSRAPLTMSEQAQGETSSRPASNTESVFGFLYDAPGNNFDVDYDGDVIMHDACS